jgi:hypothetical protein
MFSQICEMFLPHVEFAGVCVYSQIYKMLRIWNFQMCCMYLLDFRMQNCEYARCFSNVEPANMQAVFFRVHAGCFGMWICEYGYVFAKKKLQEVFRMWNCDSSRCSNAELARHTQFVWTCIRIWNSDFPYVLSVELAKYARCFRI